MPNLWEEKDLNVLKSKNCSGPRCAEFMEIEDMVQQFLSMESPFSHTATGTKEYPNLY